MINIPLNSHLADIHYENVKKFIKQRINSIISVKKIKKDKEFIELSSTNEIKLKKLLEDNILETIIKARPNELLKIINSFSIYNTDKNLSKFVYNIFVTHGYEKINKYNFIKNIGLNTCPYCNRSYIYTLSKSQKIKPEIDHFYPKNKYPILAVSYYNLIPSCPTCNGLGAKGKQDPILKGLKSPYEISENDFKFSFEIRNIAILNPLSNGSNKAVNIFFKKQISGNNKVFHLEELYKEHYDIVLELYIKSKHQYTEKYIEQLKEIFPEFSEVEINRLIIGNYTDEKDFHKRPLAKLIADISEQLELI